MIIYRSQVREHNPPELFGTFASKLKRASTRADVTELLIESGEIESALLDHVFEAEDDETPLSGKLRWISRMAARAFLAAVYGGTGRRWLSLIPPVLSEIAGQKLPGTLRVSIPEGFAYYAVYPEMYFEAARRFRRDHGADDPLTVVGIRSIGTTLSAVVAEALDPDSCWSITVRPRGHPFDRRLRLSRELRAKLEGRARGVFVIVDEGPGLSGSSFAAVSRELVELGADERRIFLFPSWEADPERFVSQTARRQWALHQKYVVPFEQVFPQNGNLDLSAGCWRGKVFDSELQWPAVHPQHERRKYLDHERRFRKFAGLGSYGREQYRLTMELDEAGYIPKVSGLDNGFLESEFVEGQPLTPGDLSDDLLVHIGAYLRFRSQMAAAHATSFDEICEYLHINTQELLGRPGPELENWRSVVEDAHACKIDGRMVPHEWIATPSGFLKTDAVDHHTDHFFPGCVDIAWDAAAVCVEWGLDDSARALLIREIGDPTVIRRLPFYETAYLAFRAAYAAMAAQTLGETADAERFRVLLRAYTTGLVQQLCKLETNRT
jgi:hypothetical protein